MMLLIFAMVVMAMIMMKTVMMMEIVIVMMMMMLMITLVIKKEVCVLQFTTPMSIYLNSYLAPRLRRMKQKKSSWGSAMNNTFLLFYSPKFRSQV